MDELIKQLCDLRQYVKADGALFHTPRGTSVAFYYVSELTQDFLNALFVTDKRKEDHSIILYDKQRKLRVPLEILTNIEIHNMATLRRQLIPHQFCPRFERLAADELARMQKHKEHLPLLLTSDPMAQIYGFQTEEIVKIYRLDGSLYFRRVVSP